MSSIDAALNPQAGEAAQSSGVGGPASGSTEPVPPPDLSDLPEDGGGTTHIPAAGGLTGVQQPAWTPTTTDGHSFTADPKDLRLMAEVSREVSERTATQAGALDSAAGAASTLPGWQTASALRVCQHRWKAALDRLATRLGHGADTFESNAGSYEAADVRQGQAFQKITAALEGS